MIFSRIKNKIRRTISQLEMPLSKTLLWLNGVRWESRLTIRGHVYVRNEGRISIGNDTIINSATWANPIGGNNRTYLQVFNNAELLIGRCCGISNTAITCSSKINIGDNVLIGAGVKMYDTDFHSLLPEYRYGPNRDNAKAVSAPITIDRGAFIGAHSIILKGSNIGENAVVGAGSLVSGTIPPNEIWGGFQQSS